MKVTNQADCCPGFRGKRVCSGRTIPPEPPDESIRYIPMTKGVFAIIDAADYERVSEHKWFALVAGCRTYAHCYRNGKNVALHRFLMDPPKGMVVDHIDGNGLNNRRRNLRVCTQQQNTYNSRPRGKSPRFKGVCWDKSKGRWVVYIRHNGRDILIGRFTNKTEAAKAYDNKAHELFREYPYLKFPQEVQDAGAKRACTG